jgi:hypothetical protein
MKTEIKGSMSVEIILQGTYIQGTAETRIDPACPAEIEDLKAFHNGVELDLSEQETEEAEASLLSQYEELEAEGPEEDRDETSSSMFDAIPY